MKKIGITTVFVVLIIVSCQKQSTDFARETGRLSPGDSVAAAQMSNELIGMSVALNSLLSSTSHVHQKHWDDLYHQHDTMFWHHHNLYHHETYTHDDHSHRWVPYNNTVSHTSHFHHPYPNQSNDSLVTHTNNHHPNVVNHHFNGHHIKQHHTLDSLHHLHNTHHP